jgi:hypothetical protein
MIQLVRPLTGMRTPGIRCALVLAVLATFGPTALATEKAAFAQPATPVITIEESIATLREMIAEVESGSTMIVAPQGANPYGGMYTVEKERVGMIGGWMVASGQLDPDSIESWTRKQIELSRGALVVMKRQLAEYEARRDGRPLPEDPSNPPGPVDPTGVVGMAGVYWPTPMDWREVGGTVRGTYRIQCYSGEDRSPYTVRGTFLLELRGKGVILGSFIDSGDGVAEAINGTVSEMGIAGGTATSTMSTTTWSAEFVREGNRIRIVDPQMTMDAGRDTPCDPGVVAQTS